MAVKAVSLERGLICVFHNWIRLLYKLYLVINAELLSSSGLSSDCKIKSYYAYYMLVVKSLFNYYRNNLNKDMGVAWSRSLRLFCHLNIDGASEGIWIFYFVL